MATFTTKPVGSKGVTFSAFDIEALIDYDYWSASSTFVKAYDNGKNYTLFTGSGIKFTHSDGVLSGVTAGKATALDVVMKGVKTLAVTGLDLKAATIFKLFEEGNSKGALAYLLSGNDTITGTKYADNMFGGAGKDKISGGSGNDTLRGDSGNDTLKGDAGNDKLYGGTGNDVLEGGTGNDTLKGDGGKDTLYGGTGKDKLYGGSGADTFVFKTVKESSVSAPDTIYDFSRSQKDKIDLKAIDASTKSGGDQAFKFIGTDKFSKKAGELRYEKKAGDTYVYGDVNGDGKADFAIHVDANVTFKATDFLL